MTDSPPISALADAFLEAEDEIGRVMKKQLSAFVADAKGLSQRGKEALVDVYAAESKRAVIDGFVRAMKLAADRIERGTQLSRRGSRRQASTRD